MSAPYSLEPLSSRHDRTRFDCGVEPLNTYLRTRVAQDMRRRLTACFVAVDQATGHLAGYYTLAQSGIPLDEIDDLARRKLPRYPLMPATRLGRLAVDRHHRSKGLGGALLFDAIERVTRSEIPAYAMVVDAKDAAAIAFYRHHGFLPFESVPNTLYLPLTRSAPAG